MWPHGKDKSMKQTEPRNRMAHMWSQSQGNSMYKTVFSTNGGGTTVYPYEKKKNFSFYLTPYPQMLTDIIDLHQKGGVIKFLKGNIGENHELAVGRDFLHKEAQTIKEKVDQMTS